MEDGSRQGLGLAPRDPTPSPTPILDGLAVHIPDRTIAVVRPLEHLIGRVNEVGQEIRTGSWCPWHQIVDDGRTDLINLVRERRRFVPLDEPVIAAQLPDPLGQGLDQAVLARTRR